jgi:hypothetical protein
MFDATYIPPSDELPSSGESQFEVTPPRPVESSATSSFFDAQPSETYGEAAEVPLEADAEAQVESPVASETADAIDFEGEVAFEAADAVMFETAFEETPAVEVAAAAESEPEPQAAAEPEPEPELVPVLDDAVDLPAAVPVADDRVLLQFAATVPHDLADLRRIAADNQW